MALTMEKQIAKFVWDVASRNDQLEQVVFTGHSAGGAIAQILYALSMRLDSAIAQAIQGMYVRVEDITADRLQASRLFTV
jgi:cephalosporin-C deacetylase-like acetyl esterase